MILPCTAVRRGFSRRRKIIRLVWLPNRRRGDWCVLLQSAATMGRSAPGPSSQERVRATTAGCLHRFDDGRDAGRSVATFERRRCRHHQIETDLPSLPQNVAPPLLSEDEKRWSEKLGGHIVRFDTDLGRRRRR